MNEDTKYNGYTNRATWLVNLWFEPTEKSDLEFIKDQLEEEVAAMDHGLLKDLVGLSEINWHELEEQLEA